MAGAAARIVLERFRWVGGHADVWRLFEDAEVFQAVVCGLVDPWRRREITKVCGIESRGFLLGGAVALSLGAGFVAVRKACFPGRRSPGLPGQVIGVGGTRFACNALLCILAIGCCWSMTGPRSAAKLWPPSSWSRTAARPSLDCR